MDRPTEPASGSPGLYRMLDTPRLTLYGVGVMIGAGIYVLIGEIAGIVGNGAWAAFLGAAVAALPTGLSYAELAGRYPRSGGEAVFAQRAFGRPSIAFLVGFLVLASGVTSTATVSRGFAQYLDAVVPGSVGPPWSTALLFLVVLSWVNHRGIRHATWLNIVCTVASVGALLVLIGLGIPHWGATDLSAWSPAEGSPTGAWIAATALAFYAYIGFEDMCNVAEEVREPHRTIPRAIVWSMAVVAFVYVAVAVTVSSVVPVDALATSGAPLIDAARRLVPGVSPTWMGVVALFAVINTALFNLIMASRLLYGMADQGWVPRGFARIHARHRTPTVGVLAAFVLSAALATTGLLPVLAESTNVVILAAFVAVNLSLLVIRLRKRPPDDPSVPFFRVPLFVPILGLAVTGFLLTRFGPGAYLRAGVLSGLGLLLYALRRGVGRGRVGVQWMSGPESEGSA